MKVYYQLQFHWLVNEISDNTQITSQPTDPSDDCRRRREGDEQKEDEVEKMCEDVDPKPHIRTHHTLHFLMKNGQTTKTHGK